MTSKTMMTAGREPDQCHRGSTEWRGDWEEEEEDWLEEHDDDPEHMYAISRDPQEGKMFYYTLDGPRTKGGRQEKRQGQFRRETGGAGDTKPACFPDAREVWIRKSLVARLPSA